MYLHVEGRHRNLAYAFLFESFARLQTCFQLEPVKMYAWWDVFQLIQVCHAWKDENKQTRNEMMQGSFSQVLVHEQFRLVRYLDHRTRTASTQSPPRETFGTVVWIAAPGVRMTWVPLSSSLSLLYSICLLSHRAIIRHSTRQSSDPQTFCYRTYYPRGTGTSRGPLGIYYLSRMQERKWASIAIRSCSTKSSRCRTKQATI